MLPGQQEQLIKAIKGTGVKTVVTYINGGALSSPWTSANVDALIEAFFGGQEAGIPNIILLSYFVLYFSSFSSSCFFLLLSRCHIPHDYIYFIFYFFTHEGHAIVDVITGAYNPGGRLPYTIQMSDAQLPPMTDYNMSGTPFSFYLPSFLFFFVFFFAFLVSSPFFSFALKILKK